MELVLVLAIMTVVVALIAPSLRWFGIGRTSKNAATQLLTLTHYARNQAIADARQYRLNFDPNGQACWLTADDGASFQPVTGDFGNRYDLPAGMHMQTDAPQQPDGQYIDFRPTGRVDPARIILTSQTGDTIEIACLSATERFRILTPGEVTP